MSIFLFKTENYLRDKNLWQQKNEQLQEKYITDNKSPQPTPKMASPPTPLSQDPNKTQTPQDKNPTKTNSSNSNVITTSKKSERQSRMQAEATSQTSRKPNKIVKDSAKTKEMQVQKKGLIHTCDINKLSGIK